MVQIPPEWLTERVDDAPTSYHRTLAPVDALRSRMAWQKLKRQATEGDEVWAFSSPRSTWKKGGRYSGYALVRHGEIVESTVVKE